MKAKLQHFTKEILLVIYLLVGVELYYDRFLELGFSVKSGLFLILLLLCFSALFFVAYINSFLLRLLYGFVLFLSSMAFTSYQGVTASFLTYHAFISLSKTVVFFGDAFSMFYLKMVDSLVVSCVLFAAIVISPRLGFFQKHNFFSKIGVFSPFLVVAILTVVFFVRGGHGGKGLNSPFIPLAYTALIFYESLENDIRERESVNIPISETSSSTHDIILIIDESISPAYLDINSRFGVLTGLNKKYPGVDIYNYGYAVSIANCSYESNLTLRFGGTRSEYSKMIYTMPSIWQYAKNAGFRTSYIDGQNTGMQLQNGMTIEEKAFIDDFIQFDGTAVVDRDKAAALQLVKISNNNIKDFVIVNKVGAHFPVHDKYPPEFEYYKPSLPRGNYQGVAHVGTKKSFGFSGSSEDWLLYRNSYRNTLLWNVNSFFKDVITKADLSKAVIIYTSDHGQDLHEDNREGVNTHCSPEPIANEGMVPLLVIQGDNLASLEWDKNFLKNKNNVSHYNIFPTLLSLMSYKADEVESKYGESLSSLVSDELTFNILFHARLGQKSKWKKIDFSKITVPPELID